MSRTEARLSFLLFFFPSSRSFAEFCFSDAIDDLMFSFLARIKNRKQWPKVVQSSLRSRWDRKSTRCDCWTATEWRRTSQWKWKVSVCACAYSGVRGLAREVRSVWRLRWSASARATADCKFASFLQCLASLCHVSLIHISPTLSTCCRFICIVSDFIYGIGSNYFVATIGHLQNGKMSDFNTTSDCEVFAFLFPSSIKLCCIFLSPCPCVNWNKNKREDKTKQQIMLENCDQRQQPNWPSLVAVVRRRILLLFLIIFLWRVNSATRKNKTKNLIRRKLTKEKWKICEQTKSRPMVFNCGLSSIYYFSLFCVIKMVWLTSNFGTVDSWFHVRFWTQNQKWFHF